MATALHEESIVCFGGTVGLRDVGLLEAALARPQNLNACDAIGDVPTLAAASGFAVARNHPLVDGNEWAAVLLVAVFVALNGSRFDPDQVDEVTIVLGARRRNDRRARVRGVGRGTVLVSRQLPTSAPWVPRIARTLPHGADVRRPFACRAGRGRSIPGDLD